MLSAPRDRDPANSADDPFGGNDPAPARSGAVLLDWHRPRLAMRTWTTFPIRSPRVTCSDYLSVPRENRNVQQRQRACPRDTQKADQVHFCCTVSHGNEDGSQHGN